MSHRPHSSSRRGILKSAGAFAAAGLVPGLPAGFAEQGRAEAEAVKPVLSPNDRPRLALIGCGGRGLALAKEAKPFGDVVALCDVVSFFLVVGAVVLLVAVLFL